MKKRGQTAKETPETWAGEGEGLADEIHFMHGRVWSASTASASVGIEADASRIKCTHNEQEVVVTAEVGEGCKLQTQGGVHATNEGLEGREFKQMAQVADFKRGNARGHWWGARRNGGPQRREEK